MNENLIEDDSRVSLVHGDYRLDSLMFGSNETHVIRVMDLGAFNVRTSISDLAYQCMQWRMPNDPICKGMGDVDRRRFGILTEAEYVASCSPSAIMRRFEGFY